MPSTRCAQKIIAEHSLKYGSNEVSFGIDGHYVFFQSSEEGREAANALYLDVVQTSKFDYGQQVRLAVDGVTSASLQHDNKDDYQSSFPAHEEPDYERISIATPTWHACVEWRICDWENKLPSSSVSLQRYVSSILCEFRPYGLIVSHELVHEPLEDGLLEVKVEMDSHESAALAILKLRRWCSHDGQQADVWVGTRLSSSR